ncbi:ABC transporter permease [Thiocystis violacea]|uniref:ABC transporter permease n=1 Tax=Thiocystis violacea TaxID=13725 RepID=UPI0019031AB3|nr:ABC transporter permease [Thiocystis violacea]MBK1723880.1 endopeptidase [Thiocystis violacea]
MSATNTAPAEAPRADLILKGRITAFGAAPLWAQALELLSRHPKRPLVIDASGLELIDDAGIALIYDLQHQAREPGAAIEIRGLAPNLAALIPTYPPAELTRAADSMQPAGRIERLGRVVSRRAAEAASMLGFLGACALALGQALSRRGVVRWREVLNVATEAGANAVPIVLLIGFLMGVIIAFEIALVAREVGAVIFVVDGVGVAMLRELGALMTAIVFAGRTGAAFAAQIGTQKVNEEINAILTFGLDPIRFLVLPRLLAAVLVVPLLTVLADIVGLVGGALVLIRFDIGFFQFYHHLLGAVAIGDFLVGLMKAAAFGLAIAVIGCQRGLATGAGATSVGLSATSAVVTSIIWIVVLDGLFTVLLDA